jgi:urea transport system permease protein
MEKLNGFFGQLHTRQAWIALLSVSAFLVVVIPILNAVVPETSPLHMSHHVVNVFGKFMCFAMVAMAMDLIWGFGGILSLGHGVFFALGGYAIGMHMMREMAGEGVYRSELPDFMVFLDWKELPWFWYGFDNIVFALAMAVLIPAALAFVFGYFAFRSRISGVYFSIITQALTFAAMLWFFRNETGFGGNNGLTDFKRLYGYSLAEPSTKLGLYILSGLALLASYILCRFIVTGRFGRVLTAIRDHENKVSFTGYSPLKYKLFTWTLSAVICGIAGALYVPQVGIINPGELDPKKSIEMVIWVAVGGRGSLIGAPIGAWLVNGAKSWFTAEFPDYWLYVLGTAFVAVTLFLPQGLVGLWQQLKQRKGRNELGGKKRDIELF